MKHLVTWSEISVSDIERAKNFYGEVFGIGFKHETMGDHEYAMFESEPDTVTGALVAGDGYNPTADGTIVYLNGGDDLSEPLSRITRLGSQVVVPKTAINDGEQGYFAQFIDSEGNRVGLYSEK
ncbi:VOC family protein [Aliikangiella coralliicola]|uniref:VOC family protein n=1 Tax=Aliikangiella coralliicola TaxID=2592383 RepID=A0A545UF83_9GAMM|nr:VOC family protein [Aliikangiella coralliicola]TQV88105.1 VOC family protein [Aliikangiella coralliicola]